MPSARRTAHSSLPMGGLETIPEEERTDLVEPAGLYTRRVTTGGEQQLGFDSSSPWVESSGLFATKDLSRGTRIICESALLTLPPAPMAEDIVSALENLTTNDQYRVWELTACGMNANSLLKQLHQKISPLLKRYLFLFQKGMRRLTDEEQDEMFRLRRPLENLLVEVRLRSRWTANNRSINTAISAELDGGAPSSNTALFVETATLRHSCIPNCFEKYSATTNRMTVHLTRDVKKGEELTITRNGFAFHTPSRQRWISLMREIGIDCGCEACNEGHVNFTAHEKARRSIQAKTWELKTFFSRLQADLGSDSSSAPKTSPADILGAMAKTMQQCRDLEGEGCCDQDLIDVINFLTLSIMERILTPAFPWLKKKDDLINKFRGYSERALEIAGICTGSDSILYRAQLERKAWVENYIDNFNKKHDGGQSA